MNRFSTPLIDWIGKTVDVIGLGVGAEEGPELGQAATQALANAGWIVGAPHQLEKIVAYPLTGKTTPYPSPFSKLSDWLIAHQHDKIALLASGDPLYFGMGDWMVRTIGRQHLTFHANISSVQAAFHQLGLSWQDSETISLHGRPRESIRSRLRANRLYAVLTDENSGPAAIAQELINCKFEQSILWVCEDLGGKAPRIREFQVADPKLANIAFHPLHVTIIQCSGSGGLLPTFPGIADELFKTGKEPGKGLITKKEVRLAILSQLGPQAGEVGWDIGAGCGSIAIEWARWNRFGKVFGIESNAERLKYCRINQTRFGVVNNLEIISGTAPKACESLPDPDAIFIGGSGGQLADILKLSLNRLKLGGRLVAAAVTEATKSELLRFSMQLPGSVSVEWSQIALSRGGSIANKLVLRPELPVMLLTVRKTALQ